MPQLCDTAPGVRVDHLGVLLRVHRRDRYIPEILAQVKQLARGRRVTLTIGVDRPSADVVIALGRLASTKNLHIRLLDVPPVVTARGCRWMESLHALYTDHCSHAADQQACLLLEDDQLFSPEGLREIRGHLTLLEADRLEVRSEFLWDAEDQVNSECIEHWGALGWRVYPNDSFPLNYIVRCPQACARSDRVVRLVNPMRDYGWLTATDRELAWAASRAAGRIDAFTLPLIRTPRLVKAHGCKA